MDKQLIDDLYKDLNEKMPKGSDGVYFDNSSVYERLYENSMQIGSFRYRVSGLNITDCDALKVFVEIGKISVYSFMKKDKFAFREKRGTFKWDSDFKIFADSVPGINVIPMSGIKKEFLAFMKLYGYHFCEKLYPEDTDASKIENDKRSGVWHGANGEEERFLAYNPYEKKDFWDEFYIKKN